MTTTTKKELTEMPKEYGVTDRTYKLTRGAAPLEFILPSRNTHRFRLLYFDQKLRAQRALRYAENQRTPFEDEQDEHPILLPIIFEKGTLHVPKTEPLLQWFLDLHPLKDKTFVLVDKKKESAAELAYMDLQDQAEDAVKLMTPSQRLNVAIVLYQKRATAWTESELLVQLRKYARRNPNELLKLAVDPEVEETSIIHQFFAEKLLSVKFNDQVFMNIPSSRNKLVHMPKKSDMTKEEHMKEFFQTEEGTQYFNILEKELEERIAKKNSEKSEE
jgi:hypothetical protein